MIENKEAEPIVTPLADLLAQGWDVASEYVECAEQCANECAENAQAKE